MHRRTLLRTAGTGALGLVAGCLDGGSTDGSGPDGATGTKRGSPTLAPPGVPDDERPYPPYDTDRVLGAEGLARDEAPLYMERSSASGTLPETAFTFTLHNNRDVRFDTNFHDWAIHRWENGQWWRVAPTTVPQPLTPLPGGESHEWTKRASNRNVGRVPPDGDGALRGLGGGTYAFGIDGEWHDTGATVAAVTRFRLEGPQIRLRPSNLVTEATREADRYEVRAESRFDGGDGLAEFRLDRANEPSENRAITEQLIRLWPLRDALAYAESDVETVRLVAPDTGFPPFSAQAGHRLTFEGRTYETSARYLETATATPEPTRTAAVLRRPQDG
jgi:hypothetical protein